MRFSSFFPYKRYDILEMVLKTRIGFIFLNFDFQKLVTFKGGKKNEGSRIYRKPKK